MYSNIAIRDLINTFKDERKKFLNMAIIISWVKAMVMVSILVIAFIVVFVNFLRQLREEIGLTKSMMKMIPVDLLQENIQLLKKVIGGTT